MPPEVRKYIDEFGWSLIPMRMADKKPAVRWKRYQRRRASESTIRRWWVERGFGLGVVFGSVSGGLVSRDFDDQQGYYRWAEKHPALAAELPTVATTRGMHVYCQAAPECVTELRRRLHKPISGIGAIHLGDGELRAGVGCYSVVPPSTHPSGLQYCWEIPLPKDGQLFEVDLLEVDFVDLQMVNREHTREPKKTEAINSSGAIPKNRTPRLSLEDAIEQAISSTQPTGHGQRHDKVFELARSLKAIPALADADALDLQPILKRWYRRALPNIRTKAYEETLFDFLKGWPRVIFPKGENSMSEIVARASASDPPPEAELFDQPQAQLLMAICRELQRSAGEGAFFLACRKAGELVGVTHKTANKWLWLMVQLGVLLEVEKGSSVRQRASRFRYLGEL